MTIDTAAAAVAAADVAASARLGFLSTDNFMSRALIIAANTVIVSRQNYTSEHFRTESS